MTVDCYKFGEFELDAARFELRRDGRVLKLERIPMELLILLAEKDGHVVTRQEIIERLWGKDVFVDTEHGINTAIRKIRAALREDAERPRFLQTVLGKGYRLTGAVTAGIIPVPSLPSPPQKIIPADALPETRHRRWKAVASALILILIVGAAIFWNVGRWRSRLFSRRHDIHSIAVLPLANLSGDASLDYFSDGLTDELITAIAKNRSLQVVSRTSVMQYKGAQKPLRDIARQLGVDGILEGSVVRSGNHVHMTVQLIEASTDTHLWAESYDRDLAGVLTLPQEISRVVANEVKVGSPPAVPPRNLNPEAHDAYLQGRYLWFAGNYERSREFFQQAIQIQPDYALAWSGLGDSYAAAAVSGNILPEPAMAEDLKDTRKALDLDDSLAEVHNSMAAYYLFGGWDWQQAEKESQRAIQLNPNYSEGHHIYSYILEALNRDDEALRQQKESTEIDPFARPWALGGTYLALRQYDSAIKEYRLREEAQPDDSLVRFGLSEVYWLKGMWKESEQELETGNRLAGDLKTADAEHQAFARNGEKGLEELGVNELKARARKQYVSPRDIALASAFLGDKEQTLKFLEIAYRERSPWIVFLQKEPVFDFLHSDERYRAIVKKIGLPPAWETQH
ncbi:MAG TPA: winged helix-turn-helix domain-containing protein [Terriglobales bacterium]|nr:winged helix-turn-helix domain-containing protein [Terriglobales bacterium]